MLHLSRSPASASASASAPAFAGWPVIAAALAFGLLEWLALARCRWQDRRQQRHLARH